MKTVCKPKPGDVITVLGFIRIRFLREENGKWFTVVETKTGIPARRETMEAKELDDAWSFVRRHTTRRSA